MLKNYFIVSFRSLLRNKFFSLVNIFGLAIGISASLVIYLIVSFDFSFDRFEKDNDRIYRVVNMYTFKGGDPSFSSGVPSPMGNTVKKEVTGIEYAIPFRTIDEGTKVSISAGKGEKPLVFKKEKDMVLAEENFPALLGYQWLAGSSSTALSQPYQAVLTESRAKKYFPLLTNEQVIGKEIIIDDSVRITVTGIVKDLEHTTDFKFNAIISRATIENTSLEPGDWKEWGNITSASQLFVKLSEGTPMERVQAQIQEIYKKHKSNDDGDDGNVQYLLQPLSDLHFNENYDNFGQRLSHKPTLYGLLIIAAFLLLLGCINFINLSTAQSSTRAKEIGIRKTMGGSRQQLIFQFLSESFLLTFIAAVFSVVITPLLLKVFADFIPEGLHFSLSPGIILFILLLTIAVSLLSGFYPAMVLSSFKPVTVLKNQVNAGSGKTRSATFRKTLTISQFVIAQVFIIATMLVGKQISYSLSKDLGFKKDAIIYFSPSYTQKNKNNLAVLKEKLKAIPGIEMISMSYGPPAYDGGWTTSAIYKDGKKENTTMISVKLGDENYIKLYKIKLLAGANLRASDTVNGLLINETYQRALGFKTPQEAVGKILEWNGNTPTPIVGVVGDFNEKSLHEAIKPLVIANWGTHEGLINIALRPQQAGDDSWKKTIEKTEASWKELYPDDEIQVKFFDEFLAKYYKAEQRICTLLIWATALAIFISCLGLLGLIMYTTNQRTKEIGVRKVIGASVFQIIFLLSKDFMKLMLIAFVIAVPIAWWAGDKWLQDFAYRTTLSWWIFGAGGCIMLCMALFILVIRTFKAASANPVKSLRSE